MLSLRQQVGSNELGISLFVSQYTNLRGSGRHIDSYLIQRDMLFGSHDILVSWTENLEDFGHAFRTICHRTDSLYTTNLINLADTGNACCHEDGGIHLALLVRRRTEHNLLAACYLGRRCQHQYG